MPEDEETDIEGEKKGKKGCCVRVWRGGGGGGEGEVMMG